MNEIAQKADVEFQHVEAVVKNVLHKLHLCADADAENAKGYIEALAKNGVDDLTHKPPTSPNLSAGSPQPQTLSSSAPAPIPVNMAAAAGTEPSAPATTEAAAPVPTAGTSV